MPMSSQPLPTKESAASKIRHEIEEGGERIWTYADFDMIPMTAIAKTLSRLVQEGLITRAGKGLYYRSRETVFGTSRPSQHALLESSSRHKLYPSGISAANILGFTTQNAARPQYATAGPAKPTKLSDMKVFTRRSTARETLTINEAALLEFLRARAAWSELNPAETVHRLIKLLRDRGTFKRIAEAAIEEPPRVRAILGAIGQETRQPKNLLALLHNSLNPLSRFDFGPLRALKYAKEWQAK